VGRSGVIEIQAGYFGSRGGGEVRRETVGDRGDERDVHDQEPP